MSDPGDRFSNDRVLPNCGLPYEHNRHPFDPCPGSGMVDICDGKVAKKTVENPSNG